MLRVQNRSSPSTFLRIRGLLTRTACPRCGDDCTCSCSGDPLPQVDWRSEISKQVSAHRARRKRKIDPNAPLLDFDEETRLKSDQSFQPARRVPASAWWTQTIVEPPEATAHDPFSFED